jgi:membrane-associated protein
MSSTTFALYNIVGAAIWVVVCVGAGWLFGNVPVVKGNFSLVTIGIVVVSLLPVAVEILARRRTPRPDSSP